MMSGIGQSLGEAPAIVDAPTIVDAPMTAKTKKKPCLQKEIASVCAWVAGTAQHSMPRSRP